MQCSKCNLECEGDIITSMSLLEHAQNTTVVGFLEGAAEGVQACNGIFYSVYLYISLLISSFFLPINSRLRVEHNVRWKH